MRQRIVCVLVVVSLTLSACLSHSVGRYRTFTAEDLLLTSEHLPPGWERSQISKMGPETTEIGDAQDDRGVDFYFSAEDDSYSYPSVYQGVMFFATPHAAQRWYDYILPTEQAFFSVTPETGAAWAQELKFRSQQAQASYLGCEPSLVADQEDIERGVIDNCKYIAIHDRIFVEVHTFILEKEMPYAEFNRLLSEMDALVGEQLAQEKATP